jgi:hypothetical protein
LALDCKPISRKSLKVNGYNPNFFNIYNVFFQVCLSDTFNRMRMFANVETQNQDCLIRTYRRSPRDDYCHTSAYGTDRLPEWELDGIYGWVYVFVKDKFYYSHIVFLSALLYCT